jgi:hypothetical protein
MGAQLPTVDQFPTFDQVLSWLDEGARHCIWYLPYTEQCCSRQIAKDHNEKALMLIDMFMEESEEHFPSMSDALEMLEMIAEHSCCAQWHRNKISGSGLAQKLAIRWLDEMLISQYGLGSWKVHSLEQEGALPYMFTT